METLKKKLYIPANHRLQLDVTLPESFPTGDADVILIIAPAASTQIHNSQRSLLQLAGVQKHFLLFTVLKN